MLDENIGRIPRQNVPERAPAYARYRAQKDAKEVVGAEPGVDRRGRSDRRKDAQVAPYEESRNMTGGSLPSSTSRIAPPPHAVTRPKMHTPKKSMRFFIPTMAPEIANATVPIISKAYTKNVISSRLRFVRTSPCGQAGAANNRVGKKVRKCKALL